MQRKYWNKRPLVIGGGGLNLLKIWEKNNFRKGPNERHTDFGQNWFPRTALAPWSGRALWLPGSSLEPRRRQLCVCSAHTSSFPSWKHVSGSHLTLSPPDRESYYLMPESLPTMGKVAFLPPSPALQIWLTPISIIPPNRFACCCFLLTTVIVAPTLS